MRQDFYEEYFRVEDRHWWFIGRRRILMELLEQRIGPGGAGSVLDVGCGTGAMLNHLERFGEVRGIDMNAEAVRFCRRRGLTNVEQADLPPLPFEDASFGLITALDVLEHIDDDQRVLSEFRRALVPGGTLLLAVPAFQFLWGAQDEISRHHRRYTAARIAELLDRAGFATQRVSYFNTLLFAPIAVVRLARRLFPQHGELRSDTEMTELASRPNAVLARIFASEANMIRRRDLPFGVSLFALAQRPA